MLPLTLRKSSKRSRRTSFFVAAATGLPIEGHTYAERIAIRQNGGAVAEHARSYGRRDGLRPWRCLPVVAPSPAHGAMERLLSEVEGQGLGTATAIKKMRRKLA